MRTELRAVLRADASIELGLGHVMRCLALADVLAGQGWCCEFLCRDLAGNAAGLIRQRGYACKLIQAQDSQADASLCRELLQQKHCDLLVVDHYGLDAQWTIAMRHCVRRILVIDDLANRSWDCDYLLDQTLGRVAADYDGLVAEDCLRLCGSAYALLRPEFAALHTRLAQRRDQRQNDATRVRLLISVGGSDAGNLTGLLLQKLAQSELLSQLHISVVLGANAPHLESVRALLEEMLEEISASAQLLHDVSDMAELMLQSDIVLGAAGTSAWERCCLGLPTVMLVTAANQRLVAQRLQQHGAAYIAGDFTTVSGKPDSGDEILRNAVQLLRRLLNDAAARQAMTKQALAVCDGLGAVRTVVAMLAKDFPASLHLQPAGVEHRDELFQLQCADGVRVHSRNPAVPSYAGHCRWYEQLMSDADRKLFLARCGGHLLGFVRLDRLSGRAGVALEISIAVAPQFHRLGMGLALLRLAQQQAGHSQLVAEVSQANQPSQQLFLAAGFEQGEDGDYHWPPAKIPAGKASGAVARS